MIKRICGFSVFLVLLFLLSASAAFAEEYDTSSSSFVIEPKLRLYGLDLHLGYRGLSLLEGHDTTLWFIGGGARENKTYYRLEDGSLYTGKVDGILPEDDPFYIRWNGTWGMGVSQGLIRQDNGRKDLVDVFLFYRGRYDFHLQDDLSQTRQLIFNSEIADREGILQNSILFGFSYDTLQMHERNKTWKGSFVEVSSEWGPGFLLNDIVGQSDFLRFNLSAKHFIPLWDAAPDADRNVFSLYAGTFAAVDYVTGECIPLNIRQTFGGLSPRTGLGDAIRGIDAGSYDSVFKAVNNLEIRANLPSLFHPDLVPGLVAYFDSAYYSELDRPEITADGSGFLFSTGMGVSMNFLDLATLALYGHYFLNDENASGEKVSLFSLAFGLRF